MNSDWMTPAQLGEQLGRTERWVKDEMAAGRIPSIKVGRYRYFTPECRALMVEQQLAVKPTTPADQWGRATRGRAS